MEAIARAQLAHLELVFEQAQFAAGDTERRLTCPVAGAANLAVDRESIPRITRVVPGASPLSAFARSSSGREVLLVMGYRQTRRLHSRLCFESGPIGRRIFRVAGCT